jgi:hypothetical protein
MQKLSSGIELRRVSFARFCSSRRWEEHRLHSRISIIVVKFLSSVIILKTTTISSLSNYVKTK